MEEDGFKLVQRRKKPGLARKGRNFLQRIVDHINWARVDKAVYDGLETIRIDTAEELQEQIEKCRIELRGGYLETIRQTIDKCLEAESEHQEPPFTEIVCYGLGNFTQYIISLYQLALLVAMKEELQYSDRIVVYDPCFTDLELQTLPSFGFHVLTANTQCQYPVIGRTFFFMLHMYREHYNAVIKSNWHQLERIVLYSNSFEAMMRLKDNCNEEDLEYLLRLENGQSDHQIEEKCVKNDFHDTNVFNDLSILTFTKKIKE